MLTAQDDSLALCRVYSETKPVGSIADTIQICVNHDNSLCYVNYCITVILTKYR